MNLRVYIEISGCNANGMFVESHLLSVSSFLTGFLFSLLLLLFCIEVVFFYLRRGYLTYSQYEPLICIEVCSMHLSSLLSCIRVALFS